MTYGDHRYLVELLDTSGNPFQDVTMYCKQLQYTITRNNPETITTYFDLYEMDALARSIGMDIVSMLEVSRIGIRVTRFGVPVVAGEITYVRGIADVHQHWLEVRARGWFSILEKRFTASSRVFTATDAGTIASTLINETNAVNATGITIGGIQATVNRTRTYEYKQVAEAIIQETEVLGGFDFEVTPLKVFNVYAQQGSTTPIQFEYGKDVKVLSAPIDGSKIANEVIARGQGNGSQQLVVTVDDAGSQTGYKLRQNVASYSDVKETATLTQHAQEDLRSFATPFIVPQITLYENMDATQPTLKRDFWVGDLFTVTALDKFFSVLQGGTYRIDAIDVNVDENDVEQIGINNSLWRGRQGSTSQGGSPPPAPASITPAPSSRWDVQPAGDLQHYLTYPYTQPRHTGPISPRHGQTRN